MQLLIINRVIKKKTVQTKTLHFLKFDNPRTNRNIFILSLGLLLISIPYFGYCWGLWGQNSLFLQYLLQCHCPEGSEHARYPNNVEVIVPACYNSFVVLSPSGRSLLVDNELDVDNPAYILDLETRHETLANLPEGEIHFLTDELIYVYESGEHIFDRTTNAVYPLQSLYVWERSEIGKLITALRKDKDVYFVDRWVSELIVALEPDFPNHSEDSFVIDSVPHHDPEALLQENRIAYRFIPKNFLSEAVSPNGKFVARYDGIYLAETEQKIVDAYSPGVFYNSTYGFDGKNYLAMRGWTYDSTGVIYSDPKYSRTCLFETNISILDGYPVCYVEVLQPVIKLKIPEEYLHP